MTDENTPEPPLIVGIVEEPGQGAGQESVFEGQPGEASNPNGAGEYADSGIGKEAFYEAMKLAFDMPAVLDIDFVPLAIQPEEVGVARAASDGIYGLIKIWCPSILATDSPTLIHLAMAAPFIMGKVIICQTIFREKAWANRPQKWDDTQDNQHDTSQVAGRPAK